jgi:hypothetical protein
MKMPLQPPPSVWQTILQILGLVVRLPFILLAMVATVSFGYLAIIAVIKAAVWIYRHYLTNPF